MVQSIVSGATPPSVMALFEASFLHSYNCLEWHRKSFDFHPVICSKSIILIQFSWLMIMAYLLVFENDFLVGEAPMEFVLSHFP